MATIISTSQRIKALPALSTITLSKVMPCGSLQARKLANEAVLLYWRYSIGRYSARVLIGPYDPQASPKSLSRTKAGYSIQAALQEAQNHAQLHFLNKTTGGYQKITQEKKQKRIDEGLDPRDQTDISLKSLLESYCEYLNSQGKPSYKNALSIFRVHVFSTWGELSASRASEITTEQIADMLRSVHEKGLQRTSNKLRSYLRSAYQVALSSKTKASIPAAFKNFGITINPVSDTQPDASANKSDKDPLSEEELIKYWNIIKNVDGQKGALLQIHLLTGGLRIQQLVQLLTVNTTKDVFTLLDTKGRIGSSPRTYTTPLVKSAQVAMRHFDLSGKYTFSTDGGNTHIANTTLSIWAKDAVGKQIKNFSAKRIRSGVETLLAKKKFSKDLRGRLQSHGISGVQDRHYDGHDYLDEKLEMLMALDTVLRSKNSSAI